MSGSLSRKSQTDYRRPTRDQFMKDSQAGTDAEVAKARPKRGAGLKTQPVAEVPVQAPPVVEGIDPEAVRSPADLARYFADSVRSQLDEHWEAPWWVQSWFADKVDWVFVTTLPDGPSWEIESTPQLWVKVIDEFFNPQRLSPAIGQSGAKLWNEFKHWVRDVDLLEARIVKLHRSELSAKTGILLDRAAAHGVRFDPQPEIDARARLHAAQEAVLDARAGRSTRKSQESLQESVELAEKALSKVIRDRDRELEKAGLSASQLMAENTQRRRVLGEARANVSGEWESEWTDRAVEAGRPQIKDPDARRRARESKKRALEEFMASDEAQDKIEAEVVRLLERRERYRAGRFEEGQVSEEDRRRIMEEPEEDDPDPDSGKHMLETIDTGKIQRLWSELQGKMAESNEESNE